MHILMCGSVTCSRFSWGDMAHGVVASAKLPAALVTPPLVTRAIPRLVTPPLVTRAIPRPAVERHLTGEGVIGEDAGRRTSAAVSDEAPDGLAGVGPDGLVGVGFDGLVGVGPDGLPESGGVSGGVSGAGPEML
jgi:hypothetical protein